MLEKRFIEKQKETLFTEKERLQKKMKDLEKFPDYGDDEDDNALELTEFESNLGLEQQLKFLIKQIDRALKAIENGTYGECKQCQSTIDEGRLLAMPYTDICSKCKAN